jgi:MoaA/NifB/PqqE/SkfB family radical SAM enzyme
VNIKEKGNLKWFRSSDCNWNFNYETGFTSIWGKTPDDDSDFSPMPMILDIEVTTKCKGPGGNLCKFCYKSNNPNGDNMSFETFKAIIDKMPWLTQVAFGADAQCESNPDIWEMMKYCRQKRIVPNITVADISDETADKLSTYCGAVAVSRYDDKDLCYDSVKRLTDRGMNQVNIHQMISKETLEMALDTTKDSKEDPRLAKLNAIVYLSLKKKGRAIKSFNCLSQNEFNFLMIYAMRNKVSIGMDSCSAHKFLNFVEIMKQVNPKFDPSMMIKSVEPCESTCFSSYINTYGEFYPCSFTEGTKSWKSGILVPDCNDFIHDIWNHPRTIEFRETLLKGKRNCPIFEV